MLMEQSIQFDAILQLGSRLTRELDLDSSVDTLGRWMSHYIAELMHGAENAVPDEKPEKMRLCSEAILSLWKYRRALPDGKRPFEDFEPILRAIESLDPEDDSARYFRSIQIVYESDEAETSAEAKSWLELAQGLDYSAKLLIRYCLAMAAEEAFPQSAEWVGLARAAGAEDDTVEIRIIRVIAEESSLLKERNLKAELKQRAEDRIKKLESFAAMANGVAASMRMALEPMSDEEQGDTSQSA